MKTDALPKLYVVIYGYSNAAPPEPSLHLMVQVKAVGRRKRAPSPVPLHSSSSRMLRRPCQGCRNVFLLSSYVAGPTPLPPQPVAPAVCLAGLVLPPCGRKVHCWTEAPHVCLIFILQNLESSSRLGNQPR